MGIAPSLAPSTSTLLELRLPATARSVPRARRAVQDAVQELLTDVHGLGVAVSEAVSNVVNHAYRDDADHGVFAVTVRLDGGAVRVTVADDGAGIAPRTDSPGLGLGLSLMAAMADRIEVSPQRPGGRVTMWFACAEPALCAG